MEFYFDSLFLFFFAYIYKELAQDTNVLMNYRFLEPGRKIELLFHPQEGKYGTIQVYIISAPHPQRCQLLILDMKPMNLHQIVPNLKIDPT